MPPQCTLCGRETTYIPQFQQWYCYGCGTYPFMPQPVQQYPMAYAYGYPPQQWQQTQPAAQPVRYEPPVVGPTVQGAAAKIHASLAMRETADMPVSRSWPWVMVVFHIILPAAGILTLYLLIGTWDSEGETESFGWLLGMLLAVMLLEIGIAAVNAVLTYKTISRRDRHFSRDVPLNEGLADYLAALSQSTHIDTNVERWTINTLHMGNPPPERSPGVWAVLIALMVVMPLVGIILLIYSLAFQTRDTQQHDERQRATVRQFENGLLKVGRIASVSDGWQPLPKRNLSLYVILAVLSLGMFLPYWWHANIEDMDTHVRNQRMFEDSLVEKLRAEV